jgi:hypothetical protein
MTETTHAEAADVGEERQVAQQLRDAEARLMADYAERAGMAAERVEQVISSVRARFADARIRSFLPILVERAARRELDVSPPPVSHAGAG